MEVNVTDEERDILVEVLQSEVASVRSEEYHAESHQFKAMLLEREQHVKDLIEKLVGHEVNIAVG